MWWLVSTVLIYHMPSGKNKKPSDDRDHALRLPPAFPALRSRLLQIRLRPLQAEPRDRLRRAGTASTSALQRSRGAHVQDQRVLRSPQSRSRPLRPGILPVRLRLWCERGVLLINFRVFDLFYFIMGQFLFFCFPTSLISTRCTTPC